ncbi:MAG: hypothetical protein ACYSUM_10475 [Planctomycetota bacterium]|jgi:hypothetical protein
MSWKTPLTIEAERDGVRVQVRIRVLSRATLTTDEATHVKLSLADAVMRHLPIAGYLHAPIATLKVTGAK